MAEMKKNSSDSDSFRRRREEAKIAAREKHGGAGMTILVFDMVPAKRATPRKTTSKRANKKTTAKRTTR